MTPASDVFALGVLLYELIAEASPWPGDATFHELEKHIASGTIVPPSRRSAGTKRRSLRGDLDTIVLKCMDQEPARRYADANELADDIERHLAGHAIHARRIGVVSSGARFLRRHPWRAAALAACIVTCATLAALHLESSRRQQRAQEVEAGVPARLDAIMGLTQRGLMEQAAGELASVTKDLESIEVDGLLRVDLWLTQAWVALLYG